MYGNKGGIQMAKVIEPLSDAELKKITVANLREEYRKLSNIYMRIMNEELIYCPRCGTWKNTNSFYASKESPDGIEHYGCKECILDECTDIDRKTKVRTDNKEKTIAVFKKLDWYFSEKDYYEQLSNISEGVGEKIRSTAAQQLIVMVRSLPQYKDKKFINSEFEYEETKANNSPEETKIVQKTLKAARKRFGNYPNEDLMFLENEYQDWINRYPCENKGQEVLYKQICFIELNIDKAQKEGKDTKDLLKSLQDVMSSLQIKPSQNNSNALTEAKTFGQLIAKWEESKPIPTPDDDFKDCDHISEYVDVFMRGHLAKMMGLKNGYSEKYDSYIAQYSAKKNEYKEDETSQSMYDQIFGGDMDE